MAGYTIGLDVQDMSAPVSLNVKQGESGRTINIALTNGGRPYPIPKGAYAVFAGKKPDEKILWNSCTIVDNNIHYEITKQTTAVTGWVPVQIRLYSAGGKLLVTPDFVLIVDAPVTGDEELVTVSENEVTALTELITEASSLQKEVFWAEYGTTTYAEIKAARDEGQVVLCKMTASPLVLKLHSVEQFGAYFVSFKNGYNQIWSVSTEDVWSENVDAYPRKDEVVGLVKFTAEYGVTTLDEILEAKAAGKVVVCVKGNAGAEIPLYSAGETGGRNAYFSAFVDGTNTAYFCGSAGWSDLSSSYAEVPLTVTISGTSASHSASEIIAAIKAEKIVEVNMGTERLQVTAWDESAVTVTCQKAPAPNRSGALLSCNEYTISNDKTVSVVAHNAISSKISAKAGQAIVVAGADPNGPTSFEGADIPDIFTAQYGTTTFTEIANAVNAGKTVECRKDYIVLPMLKFSAQAAVITFGGTADGQSVTWKLHLGVWSESNVQIGTGGGSGAPSVEPAEDDIPKVFIDGTIPTTKDDVLAEMRYVSKTEDFHAYIKIKCQGTSSMQWPKKNFTVKMFSDEARETKAKRVFRDWGHEENKYVLKANYIDHSHARNIIGANLWTEVIASRSDYESLPEELRTSPKNGAIDGFPIKVYTNGTYQGIYTWNIGKDDWMWNMDEDNPNHVLMCAETNTGGTYAETPCNFRALWSGVNEHHWSVEVGKNSDALKTSLNNLIQFIMDNDGDAFKAGIGTYLDIQSAIDYYLHQYVICGTDNLAKNMLLATYDGVKWMCGAYDMDSTWGLGWSGGLSYSADAACPEAYQEKYSLLWERIEANYVDELKARYAELRASVYSFSNMCVKFERFMDKIGLDLFAEDRVVYSGIPSGDTNNIKQIRNFVRDRLNYVDGEISALITPIACTGISLSASELVFDEKADQTLTATVEPEDTTETIIWKSSDASVATVADGVVSPVGDGSCIITVSCGAYSAECSVSVTYETVKATGITLSKTKLNFTDKTPVQLTATIEPENSTESIVWTSSDISIATVDNGLVTPTGAAGDCVITATAGSVSATCTVTVGEMLTWSETADYRLDTASGEFLYSATESTYDRYKSSDVTLETGHDYTVYGGASGFWDALVTDANNEPLYVSGNNKAKTIHFSVPEFLGESTLVMGMTNPDYLSFVKEERVWSASEFHADFTNGRFATPRQYSDMEDNSSFTGWTNMVALKPISVAPGEEYTISNTTGNTAQFKEPFAFFYKADGTFISMTNRPNAASLTFTVPDEAAYMYCAINNVANTTDNVDDIVTITKTEQ